MVVDAQAYPPYGFLERCLKERSLKVGPLLEGPLL